jgi:putative FmdB family regulatory protein
LPTYEYHCPKCNATYELRQGFDAETTQKCEECGKGIAKRVLYAPPVVFKGSGWYVTDSKGKSSAVSARSDSGTETSSGSDSTPSEPAPAKKAEPKPSSAKSSSSDTAAAS